MGYTRKNRQSGTRSSAFTLVELLVVIAIISILMTAGSIGLSGMSGKGVTSGVSTAEALFDEARTTAVGRNLRSVVLVAKTLNNKPAEDLRRILVAYESTNPDGTPEDPSNPTPRWVLSTRGMVLPDQTFFSAELSKQDHSGGGGAIDIVTLTDVKPTYQGEYYYYEFNSQGMCKTPGASFIIGSGTRNLNQPADSNPPRVMGSGKRDFGGFVIWRNGRTSLFRSPDQMGISGQLTTF